MSRDVYVTDFLIIVLRLRVWAMALTPAMQDAACAAAKQFWENEGMSCPGNAANVTQRIGADCSGLETAIMACEDLNLKHEHVLPGKH